MEVKQNNIKVNRKIAQTNPAVKVDIAVRNANLLSDYLALGFKTLKTLTEIMRAYYPDMTTLEVRRLWDIRTRDIGALDKFERVIEILKSE